jgi:hypothetical protein
MDTILLTVVFGIFLLLFIGTFFLVKRFARAQCSWVVMGVVTLGWFFGFSLCFLLPVDLLPATTDHKDDIRKIWDLIYWFSFVGCWSFLPGMQSYYASGGFSFGQRLKDAFRVNIKFYGISATLFIGFLIYIAAVGTITFSSIPSFGIALSNTYGLLLLALFLGYGLVALPRSLWYVSRLSSA